MRLGLGDIVYVSGEVEYGDADYRVACNGTVRNLIEKEALITLDEIGGDRKVNVWVKKKYIKRVVGHEGGRL